MSAATGEAPRAKFPPTFYYANAIELFERLGAAVALSSEGVAEERARIRVAAEACANPRVRVALTQAADGELDEQALEEAIAAEPSGRAASGRG